MTGWDIIFKLLEASPASATMFVAALILFGIYIASSWMKIRSFEKKLGMNGTVGPDTVLVKGDLVQFKIDLYEYMRQNFLGKGECALLHAENERRIEKLEKTE